MKSPVLAAVGDETEAANVTRVTAQPDSSCGSPTPLQLLVPFRQAREAFERSYFERVLARERGSLARVAETSGLDRSNLYRKLKALGVTVRKKDLPG